MRAKAAGAVEAQVRRLRRIVSTMVRFVLLGLLLAAALAPLIAVVPGGDSDPVERYPLARAIAVIVSDPEELTGIYGSEQRSYDWSLPFTIAVLRIAVALLVLGGLGCAAAASSWLGSAERGHRRAVRAVAIALLAGALLLAGGAAVLPVDDGGAGPAWGLWFPIGAALWTLLLHGPLSELDA